MEPTELSQRPEPRATLTGFTTGSGAGVTTGPDPGEFANPGDFVSVDREGRAEMYDIAAYGEMVGDRRRIEAYARALAAVLAPGDTVLDLGAGTGTFALIACRLGAGHVYAVEPNDLIQVGRELAGRNGLADRITFLQTTGRRAALPAPVDVIVSDLRGVLPLYRDHLPTLVDARVRHLAPGGRLLPARDVLHAALIESPELHEHVAGPWTGAAVAAPGGDGAPLDLDLTPALALATNTWLRARATPGQLLTEPAAWAALDYATVTAADAAGHLERPLRRAGTAHGVLVWFVSELAPGVTLSNAPDAPPLVYASAFFPLAEPVEVTTGDRCHVALHADLVGEDYVWRWETRIEAAAGGRRAAFRQSTFHGTGFAPEGLRRSAAAHVPVLDAEGEIARFVLACVDGRRALGDVARETAARFPERFADWRAALPAVAALARRYGR